MRFVVNPLRDFTLCVILAEELFATTVYIYMMKLMCICGVFFAEMMRYSNENY